VFSSENIKTLKSFLAKQTTQTIIMQTQSYTTMTVPELKKIMTEKELPGRSKLTNKPDIIAALVKFDSNPPVSVANKEVSLSDMTVAQLKKLLKEKNVAGRSKLHSKEEMINAITNHETNPEPQPVAKSTKKKTSKMDNDDLKKLIEDAVSNIEKNLIQDAASEQWLEIKNTMLSIALKKKSKSSKKSEKPSEKVAEKTSEKKTKKVKTLPETDVSKALSTPGKRIQSSEIEVTKITKAPSLGKYKKMNKPELLEIIKERGLLVDEKAAKYDLIAAIASDDIVRNMKIKNENPVEIL
jgi:hypothetical protein